MTPSYAAGNVFSDELLNTSIASAELGDNFNITYLFPLATLVSGDIK